MSLHLFHGNNPSAARSELMQLIDRFKAEGVKDFEHLEGKSLDLNTIVKACESGSFFVTPKVVVIENFSKNRSKTAKKAVADYLETVNPSVNLVIFEAVQLTPAQLKIFKKFQIHESKISPVIFKFADSLGGPVTQTLSLLNEACQVDEPEYVFHMLVRQVRNLLTVEVSKLPGWQISRLKSQFQRIGEAKLLKLHHELAELDYKTKTGQLTMDVKRELELLLINL